MSKVTVKSARAVFANAAEKFAAMSAEAKVKLDAATTPEEQKAHKDTMQENATHAKYCESIAKQSDEVIALLIAQQVDCEALANGSRELKKRAVFMLQALVSGRKVDDRAFDSVLLRLAAKRDSKLSIQQIQREMQHSTATQANYFKTFCEFFKFATYSKSEKEVSFQYDSFFLAELVKVYSEK
ncbi:Uncharacterised protein [Ectopseudomonas mendocina]|uniref:Uncharacterized protein n=1 Tax=Ectopseudomonas mendocina TaxID=300 RepID=A0A379PN70_ECTME|nr:hypothetical protein [Pseudomonas mendocina]SUE95765.1 Uncharacterised protein [Pseudomonas mendocina]